MKWDFTLPTAVPASNIQQYCRTLQLPRISRVSTDEDYNHHTKAPVVRAMSRKMSSSNAIGINKKTGDVDVAEHSPK